MEFDRELSHQRAESRRRTSAQGMVSTAPLSSSATRRFTSVAQAASASSSTSVSRLSSNEPASAARASVGILGVVLTLLTATSFARALQRSYQLAWRLPPVGIRAAWRPLALVVGLALYIELLFLFGRLVRGIPAGSVLEDLVTFAGACVLWTGAGWILLAGRVRPRLLAAGGLLTAVGFASLRRLSALYLPSLVAGNQEQFGLLGVAFTLFSWLSACSFIIVVATVLGAVLAEDPGRLGRFIRG